MKLQPGDIIVNKEGKRFVIKSYDEKMKLYMIDDLEPFEDEDE